MTYMSYRVIDNIVYSVMVTARMIGEVESMRRARYSSARADNTPILVVALLMRMGVQTWRARRWPTSDVTLLVAVLVRMNVRTWRARRQPSSMGTLLLRAVQRQSRWSGNKAGRTRDDVAEPGRLDVLLHVDA